MKFQMKLLWKTPAFFLTMGFMCLISAAVFCENCLSYYGVNFIEVPAADQLYIGRGTTGTTYILRALLPLIVALPFADSYFCEKSKNTLPVLLTRYKSAAAYFFSKGIAVFVSAALVVLIPFLLHMLLTFIAFPTTSIADYTNLSTDQTFYWEMATALFPRLLVLHPYLYNCLFWIAISLFSGLLGVTAYVISYFVQQRIWALVSVFICSNLLAVVSELCEPKLNFAFFNYLFAYDESEGKRLWLFFLLLAALISVVAVLSHKAIAKLDNVLCDVGPTKKI